MSQNFIYKEIDSEGEETLDVISKATKFNHWMYKTIRPYCKGNVLEIGSGIGNISEFFISDDYKIYLSDIRQNYCDKLNQKFFGKINFLGANKIDIADPNFDTKYSTFFNRFDTIFALNVIEHIDDDLLAIANCKKMLKPNGTLIILVPAYQWLYNNFDKELFHFRRYTKNKLIKLFTTNKLSIQRKFYFNAFGIIGWFIFGTLLKRNLIPEDKMSFYNKIVPLVKLTDIFLFKQIGLSVVVVGKKD